MIRLEVSKLSFSKASEGVFAIISMALFAAFGAKYKYFW
jgi:hypothetical protein